MRHGQSQFGIRPRATAQGARRGRRGLRVPGRRNETVAAAAATAAPAATAGPSKRRPAEKTQRHAVRAYGRHEKNRRKMHYVLRTGAEIAGLQVNIRIIITVVVHKTVNNYNFRTFYRKYRTL